MSDGGFEAYLARRDGMVMPSSVPPGMRIELARARLKPGKGDRAAAWMQMLNDRYDECVATLPGEQMAFETTFSGPTPTVRSGSTTSRCTAPGAGC